MYFLITYKQSRFLTMLYHINQARPDTKRICNWIHRRYGNPLLSVNEELERLVKVGELARVDYKGSASFRIVNKDQVNGQGTKQKRKKKSTTILNTSLDTPNGNKFQNFSSTPLLGGIKIELRL